MRFQMLRFPAYDSWLFNSQLSRDYSQPNRWFATSNTCVKNYEIVQSTVRTSSGKLQQKRKEAKKCTKMLSFNSRNQLTRRWLDNARAGIARCCHWWKRPQQIRSSLCRTRIFSLGPSFARSCRTFVPRRSGTDFQLKDKFWTWNLHWKCIADVYSGWQAMRGTVVDGNRASCERFATRTAIVSASIWSRLVFVCGFASGKCFEFLLHTWILKVGVKAAERKTCLSVQIGTKGKISRPILKHFASGSAFERLSVCWTLAQLFERSRKVAKENVFFHK